MLGVTSFLGDYLCSVEVTPAAPRDDEFSSY